MSSVYVAKAPPGVEGEELRSVNVNIATQLAIKKLRSGSHEITYPELILNALEEDGMRQLVERIRYSPSHPIPEHDTDYQQHYRQRPGRELP